MTGSSASVDDISKSTASGSTKDKPVEFVEPVSESTGNSASAVTAKKASADDKSKSSSSAKDKDSGKDKAVEFVEPVSESTGKSSTKTASSRLLSSSRSSEVRFFHFLVVMSTLIFSFNIVITRLVKWVP